MNQSSSIATVVIALSLGAGTFAAHRYVKSHPETVAFLKERAGEIDDTTQGSDGLPDSSKPPLDAIQEAEQMLWDVYEETQMRRTADAPNPHLRTKQLVDYIAARRAELGAHEETTPQQTEDAQLVALRAHYVAARTSPNEYGGGFVELAEEVVYERPGSDDAAQADALLLLHRHASARSSQQVVSNLKHYTQTYPESPMGAKLYCAQSEELWRNGQHQLAKTVLKEGIKAYEGHPQAGQMVNQLANLGYSQARPPGITQEAWQRRMRQIERSSSQATQFR